MVFSAKHYMVADIFNKAPQKYTLLGCCSVKNSILGFIQITIKLHHGVKTIKTKFYNSSEYAPRAPLTK